MIDPEEKAAFEKYLKDRYNETPPPGIYQVMMDVFVDSRNDLRKKLNETIAERDIWIYNAKQLQLGYNELDERLRRVREAIK